MMEYGSQCLPCLRSTSIREVNAVPPTVHSSTGAPRFPTCMYNGSIYDYVIYRSDGKGKTFNEQSIDNKKDMKKISNTNR